MNGPDSLWSFSADDLEQIQQSTSVRTVHYHPEVASTNSAALALAANRDLEIPALVVTNRQTAGRGRGTHRWWSAPGSLTFSLILNRPNWEPETGWARVSLTAGLAVCESLHELRPGLEVGLKWPNDVFVQARKICGILVEVPPRAPDRIVVGIGMNVNNTFEQAPSALAATGIALVDVAGYSFDLSQVLIRILRQLDYQLGLLAQGAPALADRWQAFCMLHGREVRVISGTRETVGTCRGIAQDGALLVDTGNEIESWVSGVVTLLE